jgi:hypothetical protein
MDVNSMVENNVNDNGTSLNDSGAGVTVFSLGTALDGGPNRQYSKERI